MDITIASVTARNRSDAHPNVYLARLAPYANVEALAVPSEKALFERLQVQRGRTTPIAVLLDSRGRLLTSEEFAAWIGNYRDQGQQSLIFAIGPPDGWSDAARARATLVLSFGRLTMPHSLMRLVLAEQIYRAFTILAGHPYHSGHSG